MNPITRMMKSCINMPLKKALPLLFIFAILLVSVMGCTERQETVKSTGSVAPGGAAKAKVDVTINSKSEANTIGSSYSVSTPSPGKKFVVFGVTVTDLSAQNLHVNPLYFKITASDGTASEVSTNTYSLANYFNSVSNVQPGEKVTGYIAFEIPQNTTPQKLTYDDYSNRVMINL